jgi:hypothetical protein
MLMEGQMRIIEKAEFSFIEVVAGCKMTGHSSKKRY